MAELADGRKGGVGQSQILQTPTRTAQRGTMGNGEWGMGDGGERTHERTHARTSETGVPVPGTGGPARAAGGREHGQGKGKGKGGGDVSSTGHMACIAWTGREVRCGAVPCVARRGWRVIDERARDKRQWERDWLAGWLAGSSGTICDPRARATPAPTDAASPPAGLDPKGLAALPGAPVSPPNSQSDVPLQHAIATSGGAASRGSPLAALAMPASSRSVSIAQSAPRRAIAFCRAGMPPIRQCPGRFRLWLGIWAGMLGHLATPGADGTGVVSHRTAPQGCRDHPPPPGPAR
ncbi:hypothetical protein PCL_10123 [Purpureocillium lilacinum]|uniref:Uncharacterized protein n=1 Tax=Purpureocillium lilacinum TaxID=33203 RepID=A0A2U3EF21_PURLI|nr:hypothetical protein PCL_10123 [Purpureocillium lilacinum]